MGRHKHNKVGAGLAGVLAGLLLWLPAVRAWAGEVPQGPPALPFAYVGSVELARGELFGQQAKSLLLHFTRPQTVLSSLEGLRPNIAVAGNHYTPPEAWEAAHCLGFAQTKTEIAVSLGLSETSSSLLYTGADMDNYAYVELASQGLRVGVVATAGVKSNALRAGTDAGNYVEPGTINLIALSNRKLSQEAMLQAMVLMTEAKTAALEDLDVRSAFSRAPATGTGTDNIIVVQGDGPAASMSGGHTRLGELFAKATRRAVLEAVAKQNGLTPGRDLRERLAERGITLPGLLAGSPYAPPLSEVESILDHPRYAGFLLLALPLADAEARGLLGDSGAFSKLCLDLAAEVAGGPVDELLPVITAQRIAPLLREALNALLTGLVVKAKENPWE